MKITSSKFREIYEEHVAGIRQLLFYKCGENDLDDLTQKVFIKAWQNIGSFRGESQLKTWLYRIAWNVSYDHFRKKQIVGDELVLPSLVYKGKETEQVELHSALSRLDSSERDLCVLYYLEGFSVKEISEVLDVSAGTVKSRLHALRESLRVLFEVNSQEVKKA